MTDNKWTPGPLTVTYNEDPEGSSHRIHDANGDLIAECGTLEDATLYAAAPELYDEDAARIDDAERSYLDCSPAARELAESEHAGDPCDDSGALMTLYAALAKTAESYDRPTTVGG